ncbi:uncharacterized protein [Maniola hyperantus]|uniref:uncharacterized protein isoform X2 n=1 Tax=Aphantopus hyperantus TaxID=2795564 RepID=UPI002145EB8A
MGDKRRENIKKSLGLSEYPWSSDDDNDNPQITPESVSTTSRRQADTTNPNVPETSAQAGASQTFLNCRYMQKLERDAYWSALNKILPRASGPGPSAGPSRASSSVEPTESIDLTSPMTNLQRISAIKRLRNSASSSRHCTYPVGRSTRSPRSSPARRIITWRELSEKTRKLHSELREQYGHLSQRVASDSSQRNGSSSMHPQSRPPLDLPPRPSPGSQTRSPPRMPLPSPVHAPPSDSAPSDDVESRAVGQPPQRERVLEDNVEVANEAMETDGAEREPQPDDNVSNQAQASGDDDDEEIAGAATAALRVTTRRANEEVQAITVQDLNRSLLRLLECPVCLECMEPPMSQCRRGHLVCVRCRARLAGCPVCRTTFSSVRNRAMEGVAEILRYPCRHGCGQETHLRLRASHEANCANRRYRCPAPACASREPLPLGALPRHFQTAHLAMLKVGFRHQFSMKMNVDQHDDWLVDTGSDLFHLRVDVNVRTWSVIVHVAYIGPRCKANGFTYEVSVVGLHGERKLVYTRETHSDLENVSLNMSRQDCFHMSLDQAANFLRYKNRHCEPDKFLDFSVVISAREPPAPAGRPDLDS